MSAIVRTATQEDARFVHDVYGYYVEQTNITFSTKNPSVEEYRAKIQKTLQTHPFYILEDDGVPLGFAYGSQLRPHEAYRWAVEATIYLKPDAPKRIGYGKILYSKLLDTLQAQGFASVYGVITGSNLPSIRMHEAMGFVRVGCFEALGYKNGEWHDVVWMQKKLGIQSKNAKPPIPFTQWHEISSQSSKE